VKLETANTLQFIASVLSALLRFRGCAAHAAECTRGVSNAQRCANSLSVDWQAWGTKCGLCWRATRDGLRHVPAGPPKSCAPENSLTPAPGDTRQLRLSARRATISVEYVSQSIWTKTTRETALLDRRSFLRCAPTAGAGKNALPLARAWSSRGERAGGVGLGVEVGLEGWFWGWGCN
jgi:hypothetical protein